MNKIINFTPTGTQTTRENSFAPLLPNEIIEEVHQAYELVKIYGKPNLVKIDVEGYEYEVMLGLTQKLNDICFEWAEEQYENINKTCLHLKSLGYENFGCIYNDDYLIRPTTFSSWIDCDIHNNISSNRKMNWGMIWVN